MLGDRVMEEEFWKPWPDLHLQISERLRDRGGTALGQACIDAFFKLDGAEHWAPEKVLLGEVSYVIDIGLLVHLIGVGSIPKDYLVQLNEAVAAGKRLPHTLWSELLVAALLTNYGAAVKFVPREEYKTSDLSVSWDGLTDVDVEVTRAESKALHDSVRIGVEDFVQALSPGDVDWHVVCFVADASNPEILSAAFDAAVNLRPGQDANEEGIWYVKAIPLSERDVVVGGRCSELLGPEWWPAREPTFFSNSTLLNGKGNPVVALRSLVPETSYLNPIRRKAEHGQHTSGRPFLIALNASELPGANKRLKDEIEQNLSLWDHVSGVLIFSPWFYVTSKTKAYKFRVITNPHANHPLPESIRNLSGPLSNELEFEICER